MKRIRSCPNLRVPTERDKTMPKEIIRLDNIKRYFKVGDETVKALRGVSFTIYEGEFVTIMGTSGSGKSTLLNTLGCLDTPTSGEYYLDGIPVRGMGKNERAKIRNRKITSCPRPHPLKTLSCLCSTTHRSARRNVRNVRSVVSAKWDWARDCITRAIRCREDSSNVWR